MELYIHIPFCMKKCNYCDFLSGAYDADVRKQYTGSLIREISFFGKQQNKKTLETIYIGGGTPSWLETVYMEQIMETVYRFFTVRPDAEITMECNPGTVTGESMKAYRNMGINRLSIGLQSANEEELKILGRVHDYQRFLKTYELARNAGYTNLNVDIMTGLPGQTTETMKNTLQQVLALKPEHISAYSLIIEKGTPFYEKYNFDAVKQHAGMPTEYLPGEEEEYALTMLTEQMLQDKGYQQYEISNFAKKDRECRHNIGYWERTPYLGVGLGASSLLDETRSTNEDDIYTYIKTAKQLEEKTDVMNEWTSPLWKTVQKLSRHDQMEEFMFLGLRMLQGVSREAFETKFEIPIEGVYGEKLTKLAKEELLKKEGGRIWLTKRGRDISNYVLSEFLF